jgi:hypothetical protein
MVITNEDHERLKKFGTIGMHYGDVVRMLLDMAEEREERRKASAGKLLLFYFII